jgi:hypothetical protein
MIDWTFLDSNFKLNFYNFHKSKKILLKRYPFGKALFSLLGIIKVTKKQIAKSKLVN